MKAIHYINQFFGQVGGETAADAAPSFPEKLIGCSLMLNGMMPDVEVTHTIICGDNYVTNHTDEALKEIFAFLDGQEFDIFFAGPAFMAGRYGVGCGLVCKAVAEKYGVPVITSMNEENPGVSEYRGSAYIFKGGRKATYMKDDLTAMARFAEKIARGEPLLPAAEEGYFGRGIRAEIPAAVRADDRVIDMQVLRDRRHRHDSGVRRQVRPRNCQRAARSQSRRGDSHLNLRNLHSLRCNDGKRN